MTQIDGKIRDAIVFARNAFEVGLGAAAESIDGDFVGAERAAAAIEIPDFDFKWSGVCPGIVEITFD